MSAAGVCTTTIMHDKVTVRVYRYPGSEMTCCGHPFDSSRHHCMQLLAHLVLPKSFVLWFLSSCRIYLSCIRYKMALLTSRASLISMLVQAFITSILILPSIQSGSPRDEGLTVRTAEGDVSGAFVTPTVRRFLGIPYAVANRWEAPQKAPIRTAPFNATQFGGSCPQGIPLGSNQLLGPGGNIYAQESEDCLNVNIWAPSIRRKQGTAVMIWIYGGGFLFGTVRR
jgi:hypothetical protein